MTPETTRKPLARRLLFGIGIGFVVIAAALALLAFLPSPSASIEPEWLSKIPAQVDDESYSASSSYISPGGGASTPAERVMTERIRTFDMPFDEFVKKMNESLTKKAGWNFYHPPSGNSASWNLPNGDIYLSFWATGDERRVKVTTSYTRPASWSDKVRRWTKKIFGEK